MWRSLRLLLSWEMSKCESIDGGKTLSMSIQTKIKPLPYCKLMMLVAKSNEKTPQVSRAALQRQDEHSSTPGGFCAA